MPTSWMTTWGVFFRKRAFAPLNPVAPPAGAALVLGPEQDQEAPSGDPHVAVHEHDVGLAADLQARLVVLDVGHRPDDEVIVGPGGGPLVVAEPHVAGDPGVDDVLRRVPRLGDEAHRLVEVDHRLVAGRRLEPLAVARLPDDGEGPEPDPLAAVERLVLPGVHPVAFLGVVVANLEVFGGAPMLRAERAGGQVDRLAPGPRLGLGHPRVGDGPGRGDPRDHDREALDVSEVSGQQEAEGGRDLESFLEHGRIPPVGSE